ncbi:MAG TPA: lipopolysaccharide biosynthesis protein [Devosia sp.]|jgi:O-antigen/teichoic acid export membrane protein|nr:lipopolysaccharide biosynthesis protein [Devosia sp.]
MSGARTIVGPALIYVAANVLIAAIPLLLLPLFTRVLSPEDYGRIAMFGVVVQLFGAVSGLSVHGAIGVRYFDRDSIDFPRFVSSCLAVLAGSLTLVFAVVAVTLPLLEAFTKLPGTWLLIAVAVSGANFVVQSQLAIFQSAGQPIRFGALRLTQAALDLCLSLVLVLGLGLAWQGRAAGVTVAAMAAALLALGMLRAGDWLRMPGTRDYAGQAIRFGLPLVPHAIGGLLIASVDRFMISNVLDVGSAGIYLVAIQIGLVLNLVTDAGNRAFAPWLMRSLKQGDADLDLRVVRLTYIGFGFLIVLGIGMGLVAPALLSVLVGEEFRAAGPLVIYVTIGQAFGGMYYLVTNYVFFAGRTGKLAAVSLTSGLLNVGLSYVLLTTRGLEGAAQAFMAAQLVLFLGTWWLASRTYPMPWNLRRQSIVR